MRMVVNGRFNVQQYAMILSESSLRYYERHFGEETLYIPPVNLNSTFSTILISIPIRREFPFLKHFNRLLVARKFSWIFFLKTKNNFKSFSDDHHLPLSFSLQSVYLG